MTDSFDRYRDLIDDWQAFLDASATPLPTCIWTNTLRTMPERLRHWLAEDGLEVQPLSWRPGAFRMLGDDRPGNRLPYLAGLYQVQEEVSMLPVHLLAPEPGHAVADLCAAPGNKTAEAAVAMQNRGTLVANDRTQFRLNVLRAHLDRLGIVNCTTTVQDAAAYPCQQGAFDRVLADVPCSCEGTSRKHPHVVQKSSRAQSCAVQNIQIAILKRAVEICRPGGRIVYSTCTYAPEENELVVDAVLRHFGGDRLRVVPAELPGFRYSQGLTHWEGQALDPSLADTMRVWPHQNDTGGFYVAVLERLDLDRERAILPLTRPAAPRKDEWLALLSDRFGIDDAALAPYRILKPGKKYVTLAAADHEPPDGLRTHTMGMPLIRTKLRFPKPTTATAMLLGGSATRNVVSLDRARADVFLSREDLTLSADEARTCTGLGYVFVRHQELFLGVGLFVPEHNTLRSLYPTAKALN